MSEPLYAQMVDCATGEVELVQIEGAELVQLEADRTDGAERLAAADDAAAGRAALLERLVAGIATPIEQQSAIATLLGGADALAPPE